MADGARQGVSISTVTNEMGREHLAFLACVRRFGRIGTLYLLSRVFDCLKIERSGSEEARGVQGRYLGYGTSGRGRCG